MTRGLGLATRAAGDAALLARARLLPPEHAETAGALERAIDWLCMTHDVTGRRGSSKGFHLVRGWMAAYPETSGYVVGTLLWYAGRSGRADLAKRARELGDWEMEVQEPDGGVMSGAIDTTPRRSVVFNAGMVLHGWLDLREAGETRYDDAAARAASYLVDNMRADGTWRPEVEYSGIPHTYNSRVAWAMLRWARAVGDDGVEEAARRQLDWVLSKQRPNGWFDECVFKPGTNPSTHGIAYTLRGLLESHAITGDERYLEAVVLATDALIRAQAEVGHLKAEYDSEWRPAAGHACLTGSAQLGGVWLRLYQETGDDRFLDPGLTAVDEALAHQADGKPSAVRGALAGSFPIWGRYAPLQYPNWATKFLADSLMLREDCLAARS
jgi:hypothetical protein